jgi:hypothetical protein
MLRSFQVELIPLNNRYITMKKLLLHWRSFGTPNLKTHHFEMIHRFSLPFALSNKKHDHIKILDIVISIVNEVPTKKDR